MIIFSLVKWLQQGDLQEFRHGLQRFLADAILQKAADGGSFATCSGYVDVIWIVMVWIEILKNPTSDVHLPPKFGAVANIIANLHIEATEFLEAAENPQLPRRKRGAPSSSRCLSGSQRPAPARLHPLRHVPGHKHRCCWMVKTVSLVMSQK